MQTINYPLLYYKIEEGLVLGMLVGTDYQVVDKDLRSVKQTLAQYLQKDYKKYDFYPDVNISDPKLKVIQVSVRPSYKAKNSAYPVAQPLVVPVPVIYGTSEGDYFECYLPYFGESFYFYDNKQFKSLVTYFAVNELNSLNPEIIHQMLSYPKPQLDSVRLRINENRVFKWDYSSKRQYKTLNRLAEQYPYSKAVRRSISSFPEAAWELEDVVNETVEKIINLKANILIVGNHGVGKSAVLKQAIKKIDTRSRKDNLAHTFWYIQAQRITASARYLGEWQQACESLIDELKSANGILWVSDMIRMLRTGGEGAEDSVAAFLTSFLQQGKLQIIGEVTPQELDSMRRLLPGFVQSFQLITIEDLPETKIHNILRKFSDYSAQNIKIAITKDAQMLAYRLLLRYYPYESFPGKIIKFLGQCVSDAENNKETEINKKAVISNFTKQTGLPELFLRDDLLLDAEELSVYFQSKIIGQPKAIDKLSSVVKIFKAGLNNPYKPIATLIFAGPTGVGKTASAKALADYFFGKGQKQSPLIRLDMSEFQHPSQINRFIGAGREVGKLVQDIRERSFSVLLLDEIEKADRSIFDALLTVLDEGKLVDAFGRVTSFRNTIIIMTTNLGASSRTSIGFSDTSNEEANYISAIASWFRPEFVNRIDGVVLFNTLNQEDIHSITKKELNDLKKREGFAKRNLKLEFTEKVVAQLSKIGFDERYGARPLQRAIEHTIINPIANWLLENPKVKNRTLKIDYDGDLKIK